MSSHTFAPLEGIRILELSQNLAGPYGTQILADLGADVIKIEPPGGDPSRQWGPPFVAEASPLFNAVNRNKRSCALDLRTEDGQSAALALARDADVVVEAFRRGVAERLGVGSESVKQINPEVIYFSVSAFGPDGPLRDRPGYDPLLQAYSGFMAVTGEPDGPPNRAGASIIDFGTGTWVAVGILAALLERQRTGQGVSGHASLLDTAVALMSYHITSFLETGREPTRQGSGLGMIAPYGAFPTETGFVMIAAANDGLFRKLSVALGLDLHEKEEFRTNPVRVQNRLELDEAIRHATRPLTRSELLDRLGEAGVPAAPIQSIGEVASSQGVTASEMLRTVPHPTGPDYVDVATPLRWNGQRPPIRQPPPQAPEPGAEIPEWRPLPEGTAG